MRVIRVVDYPPVRNAITQGSAEASFAVDAADNGRDGLWYAQSHAYNAAIRDVMLPGLSGLELLRPMRTAGFEAPVLLDSR